jgi:hypothetical protein
MAKFEWKNDKLEDDDTTDDNYFPIDIEEDDLQDSHDELDY